MAFPGSHVQVDVIFYRLGHSTSCRLWYGLDGPINEGSTLQTLTDEINGQIAAKFAPVIASVAIINGVRVTYRNGGTLMDAISTAAELAGSVSGDVLPEHDAVVIRRKTNKAGRQHQSRIFIPFVPESFQTEGRLSTAAFTAYTDLAEDLFSVQQMADSGMTLTPMHPNRKDNILEQVKTAQVVGDIHTRRDRSVPKRRAVAGVVLTTEM